MKKTILLTITLLTFLAANAQEFDVRSFEADPSDLSARVYEKRTVNDEPCAIVKVITNISGMQFDSNIGIVDVEHRDDGYWLYVAPRERRIRLMASGFLPLDVDLPEPAKELMVYNLVVTAIGDLPPVEDLYRVTFRMNESEVYIQSGRNAPVMSAGRNAVFNVPKGEHTYRFIKQGFAEKRLTLEVQEDKTVDINLEPGEPDTRLALSGWVIITSQPDGAEVYLNEQRVGVTPYQGRHIAGNYNIMLQFPLYHDYAQTFELEEGATVDLPEIEMKPRFGHWQVSSTPTGAEVYLNGRLQGTTPLERGQIASGNHEMEVRYSLYHTHKETFTIEDGDDERFNIELDPAYGELVITSEPSGAKVFFDEREVGTTPYSNPRQPSGSYNIRLSKELYADGRDRATVHEGEKTERFIALSKNYGTIEVTAEGADIYLDGRRVAANSYKADLPRGQYKIKASKEKHSDDEREIFVMVGQTENINLSPSPKMGGVSIESRPFETRGAQIFIDGQRRSETTPASIPLLIGTYDITVRKRDYLEATQRVEVREGIERELVFEMQTYAGSVMQQARRHRNQKLLYGAATIAAAGAGAYFKLSVNNLADDYKTATTDATQIYDRLEQHDLYSYISFGAAVPLGILAIVQASRQNQTERRMNVAAMPVKDGAVIGIALGF